MNFEDVKIINESNAARRALTHPGRDEYLLNQKSKPVKKIIVNGYSAKDRISVHYWQKKLQW